MNESHHERDEPQHDVIKKVIPDTSVNIFHKTRMKKLCARMRLFQIQF